MSSLIDQVREALDGMADELEPHGPIEIPRQTARRVRLRRARTVGILLLVVAVSGFGGFAGVRALIDARRATPSTHVTIPPQPALSPCEPGSVTRFLPPSPHDEDILTGLVALSGNDVWAVGEQFNGQSADPGGQLALIEHWDGHSWSIVDSADTGPGNSVLTSVSGTGSDDIWAVGKFAATNDPTTGPERPLIEHWDGARWSIVPSPMPSIHEQDSGIELVDVFALARDDAWAVGFNDILDAVNGATTPNTLTMHWDGRLWSIVPSPNADDGSLLQAVSAISPTGVWAVGASYVGFGEISRSRALVEHWDGTVWTIVPGPAVHGGPGPNPGIVEAVAAIAPNDVWVAWERHVFRWDGTRWTALQSPGRVTALAARAPYDVWAAGDSLWHWDGRSWKKVSIGPKLPEGSAINAISLTPGGDLWAVGGIGYALGHQHPFALRKCSS